MWLCFLPASCTGFHSQFPIPQQLKIASAGRQTNCWNANPSFHSLCPSLTAGMKEKEIKQKEATRKRLHKKAQSLLKSSRYFPPGPAALYELKGSIC